MPKIIALCSPKGGTGKTTISENLIARFSASGKKVLGVDFDPQQTLFKWFQRRQKNTKLPHIDCVISTLPYWEDALSTAQDYDIAILDLPPGMNDTIMEVKELCRAASLVLVPSAMTINDIDSVGPWINTLKDLKVLSAIIMNRANPRENFFKLARVELNKTGLLCPVEIRQLTDAHQFAIEGLTASDKPRSASYSDFGAVYDFICLQLDI